MVIVLSPPESYISQVSHRKNVPFLCVDMLHFCVFFIYSNTATYWICLALSLPTCVRDVCLCICVCVRFFFVLCLCRFCCCCWVLLLLPFDWLYGAVLPINILTNVTWILNSSARSSSSQHALANTHIKTQRDRERDTIPYTIQRSVSKSWYARVYAILYVVYCCCMSELCWSMLGVRAREHPLAYVA